MAQSPAPTLQDLTRRLIAFRDERDWRQFHGLKNLLMCVGIEAGELLELAQWKGDGEVEELAADPAFRQRLGEECADVFIYLLLICERAGIDLAAAADRKIGVNAAKYPADRVRGSSRKYTHYTES
ncbi:MAG: nucleotide pyrophosphohydrolase [Hyphomicrobiales bacterium]|nr:nucleotide pyrophosphohydrolase [Hyphomicrobiales bacterium]